MNWEMLGWLAIAASLIVVVAMGLLTLAPQLLSLAGNHGPAGETAAREVLRRARTLGADDLLVVLVSGGGSSLRANAGSTSVSPRRTV